MLRAMVANLLWERHVMLAPFVISEVARWQMDLARHWLGAVASVCSEFAAVMDPRPDLAVPARTVMKSYGWWW